MLLLLLALSAPAQAQDWTTDDCTLRGGAYHVVGSGETLELARLKARESALLCVFGGDYESRTHITETESTAKFGHTLGVTLSVTAVDWTGFSQENVQVSPTQAFVQYRWGEREAKASRLKFERARAHALRLKAERAASPGKFLATVPCGATFGDVVEALGAPTEIECPHVWMHERPMARGVSWGEFQLWAGYGDEAPTCADSFKTLAAVRVRTITPGYGRGVPRQVCP